MAKFSGVDSMIGVECCTVLCVNVDDGLNGCGCLSTVECLRFGLLQGQLHIRFEQTMSKRVHVSFSSIDIARYTVFNAVAARYALPADIASNLLHMSSPSVGRQPSLMGFKYGNGSNLPSCHGSRCKPLPTAFVSFLLLHLPYSRPVVPLSLTACD